MMVMSGEVMRIPKSVKVAGHNYRVEYPYVFRKQDLAAEANHDKGRIRVSDRSKFGKKSQSEIDETFLHEIIHAVSCRYLPRSLELRESQVSQLSQGLYQVLRDNRLRF